MIKVLFVCLGNICRSPMAEFIFKDMVKKEELEDKIYIESAATSMEEYGNDMYYLAKEKLLQEGIPFSKRSSRPITKQDYQKFNYIIGMEERNIRSILRIVGEDTDNKISRLLDFTDNPRDIADPWYTGNFNITYLQIVEGCRALLEYIKINEIE